MTESDPSEVHGTARPSPTEPPAVELSGVCRNFGDRPALRDLNFTAPTGRITVLLGPNGAGKTTAVRVITGALAAGSGVVRTLGKDPVPENSGVRERCGVVSAKPALYDRLTGWDNLRYAAALYQLQGDVDALARDAAGRFGIAEALDERVGGYSTGMKTRLALSRALLGDPDLLILDEPTSGLDPESAHAVLRLIRQLTDAGRTVIMCTHLLSEAQGLADHMVVMEHGAAEISGSFAELTERYWPEAVVELEAESPDQLDRMATWHGVLSYERDPVSVDGDDADPSRFGVARVEIDGFGRIPDLVASLVRDGVRLRRVSPRIATVEDVYFAIRRSVAGGGSLGHPAPVGSPAEPGVATHPLATHSGVGATASDSEPISVPTNREETR